MKLAILIVALAALCFFAGTLMVYSRNPDGRGMTVNDWFFVASVGFLILAGARVVFVTLGRRSGD